MDRAEQERWLRREHEPFELTPAQTKIMESICRGNMPAAEVAGDLKIAKSTVHAQLAHIKEKLGARNWFQAYLRFKAATGR